MLLSISTLWITLLVRVAAFTIPCNVVSTQHASSSWKNKGRVMFLQSPIYSSRRSRESYYEDDDEEILYYETREVGGSKEEMDLRRMGSEAFMYENDNPTSKGNKMTPYRYEDDLEYDDEEEFYDEDQEPDTGNYWSNPKGGIDGSPPPRPPGRDPRRNPRKRPRRSSVRSGPPPSPAAARDFYDRLFWYGFDPEESEDVGDRTVFGGTKGKFNGLAYLQASEKPDMIRRNSRQLPPPKSRYDEEDDYYDDEEDDYEKEEVVEENSLRTSNSYVRSMKPPNDFPYPRSDVVNPDSRRTAKRRSRRRPNNYVEDARDERGGGDWVSKQVSSWFNADDEDNYVASDRNQRRAQRQQKSSEWSPFNVLNAFFGVDRDELDFKADVYNQKMGIGSDREPRRRKPVSGGSPRRKGYAYRYADEEKEDDDSDVVEVETTAYAVEDPTQFNNGRERPRQEEKEKTEPKSQRKEKTWEERSLAVERVPPADIVAWGPSGELPLDARTKAVMDALEDVQTAQLKVESREKKLELAREDITILKVDAELQRRKLEQSQRGARLAQERLRQIELDIDEASRVLRRAQTLAQISRDQLEELQERHWALLRFYNPNQAEEKVAEALKEYQFTDPMPSDQVSPEINLQNNDSQQQSSRDEVDPGRTYEDQN